MYSIQTPDHSLVSHYITPINVLTALLEKVQTPPVVFPAVETVPPLLSHRVLTQQETSLIVSTRNFHTN